jgi:SRSO17 transposase
VPGGGQLGTGNSTRRSAADADYGDNPNFLAGLEGRNRRHVAAVRKDFKVALKAGGPAVSAEVALAAVPPRRWQTIRWRRGGTGWLRARFRTLRCWREPSQGVRVPGWLIGERPARGHRQDKWKYHWSNFGAEATLGEMVEYAHRRYGVEQFHEGSKGLLGWDQYQGRLCTGFQRHSVLVLPAYRFLVRQEWQGRQRVSIASACSQPRAPARL